MAVAQLSPPPSPADRSSEEPLYEVVDGVRVELPEMSALSNVIKSRIQTRLGSHVEANRLGNAVTETLFVLDADRNLRRRPDVAFVSKDRWPLEQETPWQGDWEVVPNLCVEVISPSDLYNDVMDKVTEYLQYGVEQVWVVWPPGAHVQVFSGAKSQLVSGDQQLSAGQTVPGFALPVADLFGERRALSSPS